MKARKAIAIVASVVALVVVALAGFSIYVYRYSRYSTIFRANSHIAISRALDRRLHNQSEYVAGPGGLSDDQLARFVTVERAVEKVVGTRDDELRQAAEKLERLSTEPGGLTAGAALKALGEIGHVFREAKQAQVDAMNAEGLSRGEFEWIRRRVYADARIEFSQIDLEALSNVEDGLASVTVRRRDPNPLAAADPRLQPHVEALRRWHPLAFFGF